MLAFDSMLVYDSSADTQPGLSSINCHFTVTTGSLVLNDCTLMIINTVNEPKPEVSYSK